MAKDVKVQIVGDATKFKAALADAGSSSDKFSKQTKSNGEEMSKFGLGALAVGGAIGVGLFKAGEAASNLGESVNAVKVTFGKSADGILKLGEDAATAVGLSNTAFNGLAVQFSSFATTVAGKGGDVVGVMSDMTGRAADFASVMNIDVAEAAAMFQSGLAGETEPLKKFGLDLSAAAVSAYAAANGIGEVGKELTESEKVTARYGLLMESTAKTQGDFANTADSAANATRIAKAEMENAMASLGSVVAPVMATVATKAAELVKGFVSINEASGGMVVGFTAIVGGGALLLGTVTSIIGRVQKMQAVMHTAEGTLTTTGKVMKGLVPIAAVAGVAFFALSQRANHAADAIANISKQAEELSTVADKDVLNQLYLSLATGVANGVSLEAVMRNLAETNIEGAKRALEMADAQDHHGTVTVALRRAIVDEMNATQQATKTTEEFGDSAEGAGDSAEDAAAGSKILERAIEGVGVAADETTDSISAFDQSLIDVEFSYDKLTGKLDEQDAWAHVQESILAFAENTEATAQDVRNLTRDLADYINETSLIPAEKKTLFLAELDEGKLEEVQRRLEIFARNNQVNVNLILAGAPGFDGGIKGKRASGGHVSNGAWLVGEDGPEVLQMNGVSGTVIPNPQLMYDGGGQGNGVGGSTIIVNAGLGTDGYQLARVIVNLLAEYDRRNGTVITRGRGR